MFASWLVLWRGKVILGAALTNAYIQKTVFKAWEELTEMTNLPTVYDASKQGAS